MFDTILNDSATDEHRWANIVPEPNWRPRIESRSVGVRFMRKPGDERLAFVPPMLPTFVAEPPEGTEWIHEIKYDGWRTQVVVDKGAARVFTRNGLDWTDKFAPVAAAALALGHGRMILDGEMIVDGADGKPDYQKLRRVVKTWPDLMRFVGFDVLHMDGHDLTGMALDDRRDLLEDLVTPARDSIRFSESFTGTGAGFFGAVDRMGLEGMVSKQADSIYESGRSRAWLKIKSYAEETYDIIGVQREPGRPAMVLMADNGRYVGGAFVTQPRGVRERLWERVQAKTEAPAPAGLKAAKAEWVKPGLRGRVKFLKGEETLRHASLQEWSED